MRNSLFLALLCASSAPAATIIQTDGTLTGIPDGSAAGVARSLTVSGSGESVSSVTVDLNISAAGGSAFLGDLYFYLTNGSEVAVLMNRAGRRTGALAGYSDNQSMSITLSDAAANDLHNYRVPLTGSHNVPLAGPLVGLWQPDARLSDPATVLDSDARTNSLGIFAGDPADGTWSLFAADLSSGAAHQINSWTLTLQTIPEPGTAALSLAALAALLRRRR